MHILIPTLPASFTPRHAARREVKSVASFLAFLFILWVPSMDAQKYASRRVTAFPFSFPHHKERNASWTGMFDLISFGVLHPFLKAPSRGRMGAWRKGLGHPPVPSSNVKTQACGCKDWCVFYVDNNSFSTSWTSFSSRSGRPCT